MSSAVRWTGVLDIAALDRSLDAVIARHEALRTTFATRDGRGIRVIAPSLKLALHVVDLTGVDEAELGRLVREDARAPFDLAHGPLVRARLVRLGPNDHVMLFGVHHIVFDGWSFGVLFGELATLYAAFTSGGEPALPPLAIQYADFAAWQRHVLSGEVMAEQLAYWKRQMSGSPRLLELPTDRPRPAVMTNAGATRSFRLSRTLTASLHALSRAESTTLFMTLLAAFQTLLHRYSRQSDIVVGSPIANRTREETENLMGFFLNTLMFRTDLSGEPTFRGLLGRVREVSLGAYAHQDLPFEKLVDELKPERNLSYAPLFQVLFILQGKWDAVDLPGLALAPVPLTDELDSGTSKLDLSLSMDDHPDGLRGDVEYNTDLFDESTIIRFIGHFERLLESIAANPDQRISVLPILRDAERHQLVVAWNDTERPYPKRPLLHELVEEQAAIAPSATAVVFEGQTLAYGVLNERANQLARHLRSLGVGVDTLVAVATERSFDMVVSLLAVLKAGAAYVPLDPGYPRDRLAFMISDSRPQVVLIQEHLRRSIPTDDRDVIAIDSAWPEISRQPDTNLGVVVAPDHLVYVIYTSGSTGRPKGVMNTHAGAINHMWWLADQFGFGASDSILQKTPFSFDASVWELFLPLVRGGRLVMAKPEGHQDPAYMADVIRTEAITTLQFVPAMLALFVEIDAVASCTSLRRVVAGGEALSFGTVRRFREMLAADLYNMYGQTEASDDSSYWRCTGNESATVPIGRPIGNMRVHVLDANLEPSPIGVAGEIHIGGAGLARGYLDRPALTAERFVPDPFARIAGGRLYKTGDLGRVRADGVIEFLGRIDHQVKIRGFRVELGEVEAELGLHPALREAVAMVREDARGEPRLVAYLVGTDIDVSALRAFLRERLPDYMVPSAFVVLDELPLTPNGKVDRNALPVPELPTSERKYVAPQTASEERLAALWSELLHVERIGRDDNFFELGGHSLLAVQLVGRLQRLGLGTELRTLFTTPTLAALAATLGSHRDVIVPPNLLRADGTTITPSQLPLISLTQADIDRIVARVPGGVANVQDIYALSPLQDGILFHHLLAAEGDPYVLMDHVSFPDRAMLDRYLDAGQQVVDRHDALRTAFVWDGTSVPAQVVWRKAPLHITEIELESSEVPGSVQMMQRFGPRNYRMDLTRAPLLHYVVAREPGSTRWLLLELGHHLIADHTTMELVTEEVKALLADRAHELGPAEPFRNLVAQSRLGKTDADHEQFFKAMLGDIDEPTLPFGLSEVHGDGTNILEAHRALPAALNDRLRAQARRLGVSLASVCHLPWAKSSRAYQRSRTRGFWHGAIRAQFCRR